jgi:hypothetical protein
VKAVFCLYVLLSLAGIPDVYAHPDHAGQEIDARAFRVKAAYLYNLARYLRPASPGPEYTICLYEDDPISPYVGWMNGRAVSETRHISISYLAQKTAVKLSGCNFFYVSSAEKYNISKLIADAQTAGVISISDATGFIEEGGMVGFMEKQGSIRLGLNMYRLEKAKITVDPKLIEIAARLIR